jgi:hypothetical protein
MKRTDEKFQQFFWNNFVQEDGALFYIRAGGQDGSSAQASKANTYKTPDVRQKAVLSCERHNMQMTHHVHLTYSVGCS